MKVKQEPGYNHFVLARLLMAIEKMGYTHRGYGVLIANATGFSRKEVSFILNGQKRLTYPFIKKFCTVFCISETWVIEGEGDIFTSTSDSSSQTATDDDEDETDIRKKAAPSIGQAKNFS